VQETSRETATEPDPDHLTDRLGKVFDLIGPLYRKAYRHLEQDAPKGGMPVGVRAVLSILHAEGPQTVPQMARSLTLSRQFVQRMVNDAAARGLTESVPNPAHKRSSLIRLTEDGRDAFSSVLDRERAALRQAAGDLTEADVDACLRVLSRLLRLVDEVGIDEAARTNASHS
jgi:DNA-binding MarR family transcriptional regulator